MTDGQSSELSLRKSQLGRAAHWLSPRVQDPTASVTVEATDAGNVLLVSPSSNGTAIVVTHLEVSNGDAADEVVFVRGGASGDALYKIALRSLSVVSRNLIGSELTLPAGTGLYGNRSGSSGIVYFTVGWYYG